MAEDRDFLSRWSQRKAEAREGRVDDEPGVDVAAAAPVEQGEAVTPVAGADRHGDPADADIPEELRDIDIDAMGYDADFTVFLKSGVPEALRRKALRRLWRSDPVLACLDGLNDYEEDFTDAAMAVKGLESAYRVGKGYLFAEEEATEPEADIAAAGETEDAAGEEPVPADEETEATAGSDGLPADDPADAPSDVVKAEGDATDPDQKA